MTKLRSKKKNHESVGEFFRTALIKSDFIRVPSKEKIFGIVYIGKNKRQLLPCG